MNDSAPHRHGTATPPGANPLTVEVTRGQMVESRHRVSVAVCDPDGKVVRHWGDIERPVYARSSIKPLQALPLIESGAADAFGLSDAEIALACASHNGEKRHVDTVRAWLARIGLGQDALECGPQPPFHDRAAMARIDAGEDLASLYNNCSGKHSGFLTTAVHKSENPRGYIRLEHPVQQRVLGVLEQICGLDLGNAPKGIDGCGIPVIGIPLGNIAMAMARMADPDGLPDHRAAAAKRIVSAMMAEPFMIAGTNRFTTRMMTALKGRVALKGGAEGFHVAILPTLGLGVALKCDDGAGRAADATMAMVLAHLGVLTEAEQAELADVMFPTVENRARLAVGRVQRAADAPF